MSSSERRTAAPAGATAEVLAAVAQARTAWLADATRVLQANRLVAGVWLVGSLGRGDGDGYSDVDLIVALDAPIPAAVLIDPVAGLELPGAVLYTRPKPRNAPAGGCYLAVCIELAGLPVLVDLYVWPATTAAVPADGMVLYQRGEAARSSLGLLALLDQHPADSRAGSDPDDPATLLLLIQLAAKYHARGDRARRAGIYRQLHLPDQDTTSMLRQLLEQSAGRPSVSRAAAAVGRLLDLADTSPQPVSRRPGGDPATPPCATVRADP